MSPEHSSDGGAAALHDMVERGRIVEKRVWTAWWDVPYDPAAFSGILCGL